MIFKKSSATPRTVERFARRPLPSRSGVPDRFVSGFNAMGRLFAVKIHVAGESTFGLSSAPQIFRRHAQRDGQSARCGDASVRAITSLMEGGLKAFDQRGKFYHSKDENGTR